MHPNDLNTDFDPLDELDTLDQYDNVIEECSDSVDEDGQLNGEELHWINMFCDAGRLLLMLLAKYSKPYHTSALSGMGWVNELLTGHPNRIQCELGCRDSKYVTLEEQLAIFLYACVTGLSVRHLGERCGYNNWCFA
ncbi:hypothetical protein AZE42_10211 [Rhizopogon vesiculosus]|uniref:Uncharacterized protein n=1 Tax=Rhizopogon vesiculosus TaxID=180088 RepID=A0A1J8PYN2_9AGAM|nr:hypothetical protein AZE42_10211 [Rhizopogon vesiculosus]